MRGFADKPTDDGKAPEIQAKEQTKDKKTSDNATEKIQELLKSMMAEPKISETEYRQKFATAPEVPRRRKQKDEISVKMEKIGNSSIPPIYNYFCSESVFSSINKKAPHAAPLLKKLVNSILHR